MVFGTIEFLKHYEEYPCLWDKNLPDFRNRQKRVAAEEKLLPISRLSSIKELRAKIRSIRGTYNQEGGKMKSSMTTGSGTKDIYKPKLNSFSYADSFLGKSIEKYVDTESNEILNNEINTDNGISQNINNIEHKVTEHMQEQDVSSQTQPKKRALQKRNIFNSIKHPKIDNSLDEAVKALREVSSSSLLSSKNVFGQLIATQLAQLPLEEEINLQQEIQTNINKSKIKHIRNSSLTPSLSSSSSSMCLSSNSVGNNYKTPPLVSEYEGTSLNLLNVDENPSSLTNFYSNWE